jgi:hypothetical protein
MKLTAVEWLYKLSKKRELDKFDLQQAKEMEKEQTLVDYSCGARDALLNIDFVDAVKYYNETYGGKK